MAVTVEYITNNKKDFLPLLLLGDETESAIDKYLERGELFALYEGDLKSVCVVTDESGGAGRDAKGAWLLAHAAGAGRDAKDASLLAHAAGAGRDAKDASLLAHATRVLEIQNLATDKRYQRQGYATRLVDYVAKRYTGRFDKIILGTGDVPSTLTFYKRCGFIVTYYVEDYFTTHYEQPIIEDGILLKDKVYLERSL